MLNVHSIETFGTHEGPGIRFVVFLQGCHLRCLYCHNPDTWALNGGKQMNVDELIARLEQQREYFQTKGGLTVSGGEPLIQREALYELFSKAKEKGFHTTLDTNGSILDDKSRKLLEVTDLVLLDIKHINPTLHQKLTGVHNLVPLAFAQYCEKIQKQMWLRYVLVPGYTNQEQYLHEWGKRFSDYKAIQRVEILPYHTLGVYKYKALGLPYKLENISPPNSDQIESANSIFKHYFKEVYIR